MLRLAAFDLDNTLAIPGKAIPEETAQLLRTLEQAGVRIAVCSGKPTYYLCGMLRQIGLQAPILIGENGAAVQFGVDLPPKEFAVLPYPVKAREALSVIAKDLKRIVPDVWYQPNEVGLTPFPSEERQFQLIEDYLASHQDLLEDLAVYRHFDCFDIVPAVGDKGTGLRYVAEHLGYGSQEVAAIGDHINDEPMFAYAGLALGVQVYDPAKVDRDFPSAADAIRFLLSKVEVT